MSEEKENTITEQDLHTSPLLGFVVEKDSALKNYLVEYVGTKFDKEEVTVEMIVDILAHEFPDFMVAVAEENFLRGYKTGLDDAYGTNNTENESQTE